MYNLYVHVTALMIRCNWGKPLCGFVPKQFKGGRFYHPDTKIYIATNPGLKTDYQAVARAIVVALSEEGLMVAQLQDTLPKRKKKAPEVSPLQKSMFDTE